MNVPEFYLGVSRLSWLSRDDFDGVNVFISMNSFDAYKTLPPPGGTHIAVDSAGFTEIKTYGKWRTDAQALSAKCQALKRWYGPKLLWVSPQDWMCEPLVINGGHSKDGTFAGTGLSVEEHQRRTVGNYLELRRGLGDLVIPVIQGWTVFDYWRCLQMYRDAGIDLSQFHRVGVGSVCRRQSTNEARLIMESIASEIGPRLHGYGFKIEGYRQCAQFMRSGDSFAWSYAGRRRPNATHKHYLLSGKLVPENRGKHGCAKNCAQCPEYALDWRATFLAGQNRTCSEHERAQQLSFNLRRVA